MTDLSEFLLARIADDEAVARAAKPGRWVVKRTTLGTDPENDADVAVADSGDEYGPEYVTIDQDGMGSTTVRNAAHIARWDPARVLAECGAKRRIVEIHPVYPDGDQHDCPGPWPGYQDAPNEPCPTLRLLALPYADHPDYREEWRP